MKQQITFKNQASSWLNEKEKVVKKSTMAAYLLIVKKYLGPAFKYINEINEASIQDFVDEKIKEGFNTKSIRDMLTVLRMILKYVASKGYETNKDFKIHFPKEYKDKEIPVMSLAHQKVLLKYLLNHVSPQNLGLLICMNTGLRIGEVCALKWEDIDIVRGYIRVEKTVSRLYWIEDFNNKKTELLISSPKTLNSFRTVPLPVIIQRIIKNNFKDRPGEFFILTDSERPTEPRCYRNYFKKLLKILNLPDIKFHGLRHSFATRCIESQCDYKVVSAILGHADIATTLNLYVHPTYEQKRKCIEKMLKSLK